MSGSTEITTDPVPAAALTSWLAARAPQVSVGDGPVEVRRISGGHSNLTFRIVDGAGNPWALRRPPLGGVLATAHDMGREWRFIAALDPTPVPVPQAVAFCSDQDVIGADFYVMGFVDGVVPGDPEAGAAMPVESRHAAGLACADVLAELHRVDPEQVGLGDLRRSGSYLERQLRRWHRQVHASAVEDLSVIDAVHEKLVARMPDDPELRIAHGDYRPGNLSFRPDGAIGAIFDWELATLGDPLADLGWLIASWERPGDTDIAITSGPTVLDGWPEADEVVARYAERSGRGERIASDLDYFLAFARWRSACIGAGVYTRYAAGHMGTAAIEEGALAEARLKTVHDQAAAALNALGG
jgi:aminoglycoside phosphotransferase (APT) family kinase protein